MSQAYFLRAHTAILFEGGINREIMYVTITFLAQ